MLSFGEITVSQSAFIGSEIARTSYYVTADCWRGTSYFLLTRTHLETSPVNKVWETGTPGIGIKIERRQPGFDPPTGGPGSEKDYTNLSPASDLIQTWMQVTLHKTGPIEAGPVSVPLIVDYRSRNQFTNQYSAYQAPVGLNNTTIHLGTCQVPTSDFFVTLPDVTINDLTYPGPTVGRRDFTITLDCPSNIRPYISMTDAINPSNSSTILSLAPESTATRVGVVILRRTSGGDRVTFGPDTMAPNSYRWRADTSGKLGFTAMYMAIQKPVTPGTVKALATFTLSYE